MAPSNGNILHATGPLWREVTGHRCFSSHKGQWHGAFMFFVICAGTNGWANHRDAGDLARHYAHYSVSVMSVDHVVQRHMVPVDHNELMDRCLHALACLFWRGWLSGWSDLWHHTTFTSNDTKHVAQERTIGAQIHIQIYNVIRLLLMKIYYLLL